MSNEADHLKALVAFGTAGMQMLAMRLLSLFSMAGLIGLAFYVAWTPSWAGVAVAGIVGICFVVAARLEGQKRPE